MRGSEFYSDSEYWGSAPNKHIDMKIDKRFHCFGSFIRMQISSVVGGRKYEIYG